MSEQTNDQKSGQRNGMVAGSTNTLPDSFGEDWVTAMLNTVLGHAEGEGVASSLGELDRKSGDGDFGANLVSAFQRVREEIDANDPQDYKSWLTAVSRGFLGTGGTSGPLFGMFFRELARCAGTTTTPSLQEIGNGLSAGAATVQRYGRAQVGHKTMVDAFVPAAEELSRRADRGDPVTALEAASRAARDGALVTRNVVACRGRASYVGEVARGVLDPGAVAAALMIQCAATAATGGSEPADSAWTA